jgi:hypothetical protein
LEKSWLCTSKTSSGLAHRTVRWCTGQCLVPQARHRWTGCSRETMEQRSYKSPIFPVVHQTVWWVICAHVQVIGDELVALGKRKRRRGYNSPDCPVVHQTVRWVNGSTGQRSSARSMRDTWSAPTVGWAHRTVSGAPTSLEDQRSAVPGMEGNRAPDCYSGCPVHHSTEGRNCLPSWSPTASSCLGAIKGTPRCMEHDTKSSLSILRLPDSASTHLIDFVSDLSSVWVANSLCCVSSSSLGLCAWVCCGFGSCVCCSPMLTLVFSCDENFVRARGSNLWRFLANGKISKRKRPLYSSWSSDHLKGVECNPRPFGCHNVEVGKCYLAEPRDKNRVSLVLLFCVIVCVRKSSLHKLD